MRAEWKNIVIAGLLATAFSSYAAEDQKSSGTEKKPVVEKKEVKKTVPKDSITQGEFARILAIRLGLFPSLTTSPTIQECATALSAQGISPLAGWALEAALSKPDFARMMIQAMGEAGKIPAADQGKPEAWTALAGKLGIVLEHATDGVGSVDPLVEQFSATLDSPGSSSDPLVRREIFAQPDEKIAGTNTGVSGVVPGVGGGDSAPPIPASVVVPGVENLNPKRPSRPKPPAPSTQS
jgi:hypothetical protein